MAIRATIEEVQAENAMLRQHVTELERQLEMTQRMITAAPHMLYVLDLDNHSTTYASRDLAEMMGYTPEELHQMGSEVTRSVMHPDDLERQASHFAQFATITDGVVIEFEYRMRHRTGEWHWFLSQDTIFTRTSDGTPHQIIGLVQDITQRKRVEQMLHETAQRLEFALEGSNDGVWDWNIVTNEDYFSPRFNEMLGYAPNELPNRVESWLNLIHPDDIPHIQQVLDDYLEGRRDTYEVEHRLQHKSGEWLWILSRGKVVAYDEAGQPQRMTGTNTDITIRRKIEDELRVFKAIFENASDPIAVARVSDGVITLYNEAHRAQYRCGDNHREQPVAIVVAEEHQARLPAILQEIVEQGSWQGQLTHVRHDGTTFPALESCFTIQDHTGNAAFMIAMVRDITDMIEAQAQQQVIDVQRAAIRELSTPLIPLSEEVVMMPLIGTIDSGRAQMIMETLLGKVAQYQANLAILDITGVSVVDTQVAQALMQAAQAVKLLGAQVMLTGIQPRIAQTLVHLGVDLGSIVTQGTLQDGIAEALKNKRNGRSS